MQLVCEALSTKLESASASRSFKVQVPRLSSRSSRWLTTPQTLLPCTKPTATPAPTRTQSNQPPSRTSSTARKVAPNKLVRTDQNAQTLDGMFPALSRTTATEEPKSKRRKEDHEPAFESLLASEGGVGRTKIPQSECVLKSVRGLRDRKSVV